MSLNFRRHYRILIVLAILAFILAFALGDLRVVAYNTQTKSASTQTNRVDFTNDIDLFDDTVVHRIQVIMPENDYDAMITTYQETGGKEYFKADVIIDGLRVNEVGIRLKGNASLRTALGGVGPPENGQPPDAAERPPRPEQGEVPEGFVPGERPESPEGFGPGAMPQMPGGQGMMRQASADQVKIPFMIKLDEYEDQTYQGHTAISIRNYGVSYDEALLQEPVTNQVAQLAGIPAAETAYTGFKINQNEERLYVVSELVNEEYLAVYFEDDNGILYKAELGSTLTYQGEDPSSYANSFTQQTRLNDADLKPLIDFMRFLSQADDASFEEELRNYLNVDSFATYLAVNALLVNTDSMIGMNNNYYLYYQETTGQFTILMWDGNESLGKLGGSTTFDLSLNSAEAAGGPGGRGGITKRPNALLTRFLEIPAFQALYEEKVKKVYQEAFLSGTTIEIIDEYSALIHAVNAERQLVNVETYDAAVDKVLSFIAQRGEYLQTIEWLSR